jgi:hypothetical protein
MKSLVWFVIVRLHKTKLWLARETDSESRNSRAYFVSFHSRGNNGIKPTQPRAIGDAAWFPGP